MSTSREPKARKCASVQRKMLKTFGADALVALLGAATAPHADDHDHEFDRFDEGLVRYLIDAKGVWLSVMENLSSHEIKGLTGYAYAELAKVRALKSGQRVWGLRGGKPLLSMPFTLPQFLEFDRRAGGMCADLFVFDEEGTKQSTEQRTAAAAAISARAARSPEEGTAAAISALAARSPDAAELARALVLGPSGDGSTTDVAAAESGSRVKDRIPPSAELLQEHAVLRRSGDMAPTKHLAEKYEVSGSYIRRRIAKAKGPVAPRDPSLLARAWAPPKSGRNR